MTNTDSNKNEMHISNKMVTTWVTIPAKRLLAEAELGNMTKEQQNTFFKQMQLAMGGIGFRQFCGDIESQGAGQMPRLPSISTARLARF